MTKFEAIDVENLDEETRGGKKNKKFNPENVSFEDVIGGISHGGNINPEELYELMKKGRYQKEV